MVRHWVEQTVQRGIFVSFFSGSIAVCVIWLWRMTPLCRCATWEVDCNKLTPKDNSWNIDLNINVQRSPILSKVLSPKLHADTSLPSHCSRGGVVEVMFMASRRGQTLVALALVLTSEFSPWPWRGPWVSCRGRMSDLYLSVQLWWTIRRNSVLEELSDNRLEVIQEVFCVRAFWSLVMLVLVEKSEGWGRRTIFSARTPETVSHWSRNARLCLEHVFESW